MLLIGNLILRRRTEGGGFMNWQLARFALPMKADVASPMIYRLLALMISSKPTTWIRLLRPLVLTRKIWDGVR